jgi:RNA polymerase sigma-70 factor (ECF subfamily)
MPDWPATQTRLLARLGDPADPSAWREFIDLYGPVIYRHARRQGLQEADAAEVSQEVFRALVTAFRRRRYDRARGPFRNWLFVIARNKTLHHLQRQGRQPLAIGDSHVRERLDEQTGQTDEDAWERDFERQLFVRAAELARRQCDNEANWQAFWRTAVQGEKAVDVARALGAPVGSVYSARSRIQARIAELARELRDD